MAYTDREDLNQLGILYQIGKKKSPFFSALGGLNSGRTTQTFIFSTGQTWSVTPTNVPVSEADAVAAQTASTKTRTHDLNTVQIFQECYEVSYAKQSTYNEVVISAGTTGTSSFGNQPVNNELTFQKTAAMKQIAGDIDYAFINGTYINSTGAAVAAGTAGILDAIDSYSIDGGAAYLTKAKLDALLVDMSTDAQFENMILLCNAFQLTKISDVYGYAPESINVGGVNIQKIITNFCEIGIMWDPNMPVDTIAIVDMSVLGVVYCPISGKLIIDEPLAKVGASEKGQIYTQVGLDYGPEMYHGSITNLKYA